jgi:tetratricopeptide (TPR) repeat protein
MNKNSIYWLLIGLTLLVSAPVHAQQKEGKSVERYQTYKKRSAGPSVAELLNDANALKESNAKEALNKVEEALGISLAQKDTKNEARCYLMLGEINENIQEWNLALENFSNAHELLKDESSVKSSISKIASPTTDLSNALRGLANAHLKLGRFDQALDFLNQALALPLNSTERSERMLDVSEVYYQKGEYDRALKTLDEISDKKIVNESLEARIQNQRAKIYAKTNEFSRATDALALSQNSMRAAKPQKTDAAQLATAKEEVVDALHDNQLYDAEIDLRNKSIEYNLESNDLPEVTKDKVGLGRALDAKGETNAAIRELEEAAHIADTINDPKEQSSAFLALADLYEKHNRKDQALSAYKKYSKAVVRSEEQFQTKLVEKTEILKKQKDIEELGSDVTIGQQEEQATVLRQQLIIYGLLFIIAIIVITSYFIYRSAQASKVANQLLALKSLRSQMNPHFIFNALNSVNHFVAQNDERTANKFLSEFSRLMRLVLEYSQEDFIPLSKEQEIISLYLKLEHYRFRDKFEYDIQIEEDVDLEAVEIPPMLVQPYIENAVWHGLRYKETKGTLLLKIGRNGNGLKIQIADNGIGRKRSAELKTENQKRHNSTGLRNIRERLAIINKVYHVHYQVDINDFDEASGTGTNVVIHLPIRKIKS